MIEIEILSWLSTIFFLLGVVLFTGKKASNPKIRSYGLLLYVVGGAFYIIFCSITQLYAFVITQSVFEILNLRGIINCKRELNK